MVLQLCDGSGVPLLDAYGDPIVAVTDANGYYEFTMLYSGMYSIVEVQPSQYLPGIDTAGSKGGLVINSYASLDPGILSTLAVDPAGSAIVQIWIDPGDVAVEYNFSEVLVQSDPPENPPYFPPHRLVDAAAAGAASSNISPWASRTSCRGSSCSRCSAVPAAG